MNILLIIVAVIFIVGCIKGSVNGLFKSIFSLVAVILAVYLTVQLTPYTTDFLKKNTKIDDKIQTKVEKTIGFQEEKDQEKKSVQKKDIDSTGLPDVFQQFILENNYDSVYEKLGVNSFYEYITTYIAGVILRGVAYIITFLLVWIVLKILFLLLNGVTKIPILNGLNRIGGFVFGFAEALIVVWILLTLITVFSHTGICSDLFKMIEDNSILKFLYDHNLLYKYFKYFLGTFFLG